MVERLDDRLGRCRGGGDLGNRSVKEIGSSQLTDDSAIGKGAVRKVGARKIGRIAGGIHGNGHRSAELSLVVWQSTIVRREQLRLFGRPIGSIEMEDIGGSHVVLTGDVFADRTGDENVSINRNGNPELVVCRGIRSLDRMGDGPGVVGDIAHEHVVLPLQHIDGSGVSTTHIVEARTGHDAIATIGHIDGKSEAVVSGVTTENRFLDPDSALELVDINRTSITTIGVLEFRADDGHGAVDRDAASELVVRLDIGSSQGRFVRESRSAIRRGEDIGGTAV